MTITERIAVTAALRRALALSPARATAIAVVAQATALPEETVADCMPRCNCCQVELVPADEHYNDGRCDACEGEACEDVADLVDAGQGDKGGDLIALYARIHGRGSHHA